MWLWPKVTDDQRYAMKERIDDIRWLRDIENFFDRCYKPKEVIRVDPWDSWNAEDTIAKIAYPVLKQLAEKKMGAPYTDDEDAPEHLRSTSPPAEDEKYSHTDANHFVRWNWILGEMIFALGEISKGNWEDQYYDLSKKPGTPGSFDRAGHDAHYERIKNGLRLFGKYFMALWD
jgi:hypothetical protein